VAARSRLSGFFRSFEAFDVVPAVALAIYGSAWIALHASQARGYTHTTFQALALAESVVAILLVRRKPLGSLLGILVAYLLFDLPALTLPPALFALAVLASIGTRRAVVAGGSASLAAVVLMPYIHGEAVNAGDSVGPAGAVVASVLAGLIIRTVIHAGSDEERLVSR
jgi:hypothetical protein